MNRKVLSIKFRAASGRKQGKNGPQQGRRIPGGVPEAGTCFSVENAGQCAWNGKLGGSR